VREDRIAQDVSFFSLGLVSGASIVAGQATVRPGVDPAVVEAAFEEELERIGREPVTDDELARARALIETYELEALQRVDERADRLSSYATLLDDPDMINRQLERYLAVGAAEIQAVAAEVLRPDNRVVLTYVPAATAVGAAAGRESAA
jgi:predicted Zn-dependent peptidase